VSAPKPGPGPLLVEPIGIVHSPLASKVEAARQPRAAAGTCGTIELYPGRNFEHALEDLEGWDHVWVIYWFHLNASWRPKVLPPRSTSGRKGVFATRSPHRPNPIGLSAVRLERVDGLLLHVSDLDMLDGTPVLDIKPYVAYSDAHPGATSGWLDGADAGAEPAGPADPLARFAVAFTPLAARQAGWIEARTGLAIGARIGATLALGPQPHPYRRIRREAGGLRLAVKDWRVRFTVHGREVQVTAIESGYRPAQLARRDAADMPALVTHREFVAAWPPSAGPDAASDAGPADVA
jgi:tRNA-Thr(GGU) m(6)t(6)A37 methyltransferase TsaA